MKTSGSFALAVSIAAATLAGCSGSQSPIGAPGTTLQSRAIVAQYDRDESWMLPEAKSGDLLYTSSPSKGALYIYTYPKGKLVGTVTGLYNPLGECVDAAGNVFVVTQDSTPSSGSYIYEYAHGGSSPIAILSEPGSAEGCAIDPKTGNLAVANIDDLNNPYYSAGDVAIYKSAQGNPTMYYISEGGFVSCSYDEEGNLYLAAWNTSSGRRITLDWLVNGGKLIGTISLDRNVYNGYLFEPTVQWDGDHITISTVPQVEGRKGSGLLSVYQLQIDASKATVVDITDLKYKKNRHRGQTWIYEDTVIGIDDWKGSNISTWSYPKGGAPRATFESKEPGLWGVAISPGSQR